MDLTELFLHRQSCRDYTDNGKPLVREKLEKILQAALLAPSAKNSQPWFYYAAISEEKIRAVAKAVQPNGRNAFASKCCAFAVVTEEKVNLGLPPEGEKRRYFAEMDIGLSVMQLCLEADALGVSSCIIGMFDRKALADALDIPPEREIKLVIALGYAATDEIRPKTRKPFDEKVKIV